MNAAPGRAETRTGVRRIALALLVLVALTYAPSLDAGFVWDDDANLTENLALRSVRGLTHLWLTPGTTTQYYPVVYSTFWIEYQLFGLDPRVYHFVNVLLHALSTLVLWRLLALLRVPGALFAAALFAVHPVQVETVAWVTERKNLLSSFFYLSSLYLYFRHGSDVIAGSERSRRGYAASFGFYCAALLSKITTVTLGPSLLVVTWWKRGRILPRDWKAILPMIAIGIPLGLLTRSMESGLGVTLGFEWDPTPIMRALQAGRALFFYLGCLVWPVDLAFVYPRWEIDATAPLAYLPLAFALVLPALLYGLRGRIGRAPLAAFLIFAGTLAPVLGLLEVYYFRFSYVADHWQYLACIAPFALFAGASSRIAERAGSQTRALMQGCGLAVVIALACVSHLKSRDFESALTLWQEAVTKSPDSYLVRYNLGLELQQRDRLRDAMDAYRHALRIRPDSVAARVNMGLIESRQGNGRAAIAHYEEGLAIEPDNPRLLWNLGLALEAQGQPAEGLARLARSLEIRDPRPGAERHRADAHAQYASLLVKHGRPAQAVTEYRRALSAGPNQLGIRMTLARLLVELGRTREARRELEALLESQPNAPGARALLGRLGPDT
jgi:tetratricopeptide (TPR) repeat protein